jgi:hypothetical protein
MTSLLGYLFDGLLNISKARMRFKEHCASFNLQSKRWGPKNIFQSSMRNFEASRIMIRAPIWWLAKYLQKQEWSSKKIMKKRSQECISMFNWQQIEVSRKMSSLGLMNSQYNIARFNWKIWCLKKEKFMGYLMVCQTFQKQEWNPTNDCKSSINKFVI